MVSTVHVHVLCIPCYMCAYMLLACILHVPPLWACSAGFGEGALLRHWLAVMPSWRRHPCGDVRVPPCLL
jgi:hypothetical protein